MPARTNCRINGLEARKKGPESHEYEDALRAVLKELYELVGRSVIKGLQELNIPGTISCMVVPNIRLLFSSTPCDGSGPIGCSPERWRCRLAIKFISEKFMSTDYQFAAA